MRPHVDSVAAVVGRQVVDELVSKGYARGGIGRRWSRKGLTAYPFRGAFRRPRAYGMNSVARKLVQQ